MATDLIDQYLLKEAVGKTRETYEGKAGFVPTFILLIISIASVTIMNSFWETLESEQNIFLMGLLFLGISGSWCAFQLYAIVIIFLKNFEKACEWNKLERDDGEIIFLKNIPNGLMITLYKGTTRTDCYIPKKIADEIAHGLTTGSRAVIYSSCGKADHVIITAFA